MYVGQQRHVSQYSVLVCKLKWGEITVKVSADHLPSGHERVLQSPLFPTLTYKYNTEVSGTLT